MISYSVFFILLYRLLLCCADGYVLDGALNEPNVVNVSQSEEVKIKYVYNLSMDHNMYVRVYMEAILYHNESILIILNNNGDKVNHVKLSNMNNQSVASAERTLCHTPNIASNSSEQRTVSVDISTKSYRLVSVKIEIRDQKDFQVSINTPRIIHIDKMSPVYFLFNFDNETEQVNVRVNTSSKMCMILSIQDAECPVYEVTGNVKSKGIYQSVTSSGSIVVQKSNTKENRFFVVFVITTNKHWCKEDFSNIEQHNFTFEIETIPSRSHYVFPVFTTIGFYLVFYIIAAIISFLYNPWSTKKSNTDVVDHGIMWCSLKDTDNTILPSIKENDNDTCDTNYANGHSLDSTINKKVAMRVSKFKRYASISEYFKKPPKKLNENYLLFCWYLIIISVFYALPVIQLVITYQTFQVDTGNQDICYFNFKCTRPFHIFTAFNNIFSNVGFVLLGILFILITLRRDFLYKKYKKQIKNMRQDQGIPQYYGLFYAMGVSLIMEGIMSACYHICPTKSNIQFDTAFMYMMLCLCMLKIYQTRHPDFNFSAYKFFMTMSFLIFVGVIGVNYNIPLFWIVFTISYIIINVLVTIELYYVGQCKINFSLPCRAYKLIVKEKINAFKPEFKIRMISLSIINVANFTTAIFGVIKQPRSFTAFLLAILMFNLSLYLVFYIIMKIKTKEHFSVLHIIYIVLATIFWGLAAACFLKFPTQWLKTPAESREQNLRCVLFDFYDIHDVWHLLSAMALFFSFLALQTLDDNLLHVKQDNIPEF